jgi:hypothetical protein
MICSWFVKYIYSFRCFFLSFLIFYFFFILLMAGESPSKLLYCSVCSRQIVSVNYLSYHWMQFKLSSSNYSEMWPFEMRDSYPVL